MGRGDEAPTTTTGRGATGSLDGPLRVLWPETLSRAAARRKRAPLLLLGWQVGEESPSPFSGKGRGRPATLAVVSALEHHGDEPLSERAVRKLNAHIAAHCTESLRPKLAQSRLEVIGVLYASAARGSRDAGDGVKLVVERAGSAGGVEGLRFQAPGRRRPSDVQLIVCDRPGLFHRAYPPSRGERPSQRPSLSLGDCLCSLNEACLYEPFSSSLDRLCVRANSQAAASSLLQCSAARPDSQRNDDDSGGGGGGGDDFCIADAYFHSHLWAAVKPLLLASPGPGPAHRHLRRQEMTDCDRGRSAGGRGCCSWRDLSSRHQSWIASWDKAAAKVADHALGLLLAAWIFQNRGAAAPTVLRLLDSFKREVVLKSIGVLEGAPGGLKLYEDLSHFFAWTCRSAIGTASSPKALEMLVGIAVRSLVFLSGFFGLQRGISLMVDLSVLLAAPYIGLYYAYALIFRVHWRLTREMYLLFRGRWQDKSGNSEDFVIEHVIVGVLLLTPLLFLMPTVLVYHAFWALVFLALKITLLGIQTLLPLAKAFPFAALWLRLWRPGLFQAGIRLEFKESGHLTVRPRCEPWLGLLFSAHGSLFKGALLEVARDLKTILSGTALLPLFKTIHPRNGAPC